MLQVRAEHPQIRRERLVVQTGVRLRWLALGRDDRRYLRRYLTVLVTGTNCRLVDHEVDSTRATVRLGQVFGALGTVYWFTTRVNRRENRGGDQLARAQ